MRNLLALFSLIAFILLGVGVANAWYVKGFVYCDDNQNGVIDEGDRTFAGVDVNVVNESGTWSGSDTTRDEGACVGAGYYYIRLPDIPDRYILTLDESDPDLPSDAIYIIPQGGVYYFEATDTEWYFRFDWLIDSVICHDCNGDCDACRVTAGGNKDGIYCPVLRNGDPDDDYCETDMTSNDITHTWGGQAGAPPRIDGNWTHKFLDKRTRPHDKFTFHSNELFFIQCSDPGAYCQPARPAPNRQIDFAGIGRFTNTHGAFRAAPDGYLCFKVHLEDIGEPGPGGRWPNAEGECTHCPGTAIVEPDCTNCTDYYEIEIYDSPLHDEEEGECLGNLLWRNGDEGSPNCSGSPVFVAPFAPYEGFFTRSGNVQIHPDNNGP
jgi:hypothetical protein